MVSYFYGVDKPIDTYTAYLSIECLRFAVDLERDGVSGEFVSAERSVGVGLSPEEEEVLYRRMEQYQGKCQPKKSADS
jgi:hypothetical protein